MIPTAWSVLFDGDRVSPDVARRVQLSDPMEGLRGELRRFGDRSFAHEAETAIEEALRQALDVSLLEVLMPAWRQHPGLPAALQQANHEDGIVLFGLGEHEVVSTHRPRVDVVGPKGTLASFQFELRIELRVQSATLRFQKGKDSSRVTIGACSGAGSLRLGEHDLITSEREDIKFPDEVTLEEALTPGPGTRLPG